MKIFDDAEMSAWNTERIGFVAEGRTPEPIAPIRALGSAKSSIDTGTDVGGARDTAKFDAVGSTAAIKTMTEQCKFGGAG